MGVAHSRCPVVGDASELGGVAGGSNMKLGKTRWKGAHQIGDLLAGFPR